MIIGGHQLHIELVDGLWLVETELEPDAIVTYSEEPCPETGHEGWIWWALGDMGEADSCEAAKAAAEAVVQRVKADAAVVCTNCHSRPRFDGGRLCEECHEAEIRRGA